MLMVAMKPCSAQLRHQNEAVTARPHAVGATCTRTQKECFHSASKCLPVGVNSIQASSFTNNQPLSKMVLTALRC